MLDSIAEFCYNTDRSREYENYHNHTKYEIKQCVVNYVNTALVLYIYIYILIYIYIYYPTNGYEILART